MTASRWFRPSLDELHARAAIDLWEWTTGARGDGEGDELAQRESDDGNGFSDLAYEDGAA